MSFIFENNFRETVSQNFLNMFGKYWNYKKNSDDLESDWIDLGKLKSKKHEKKNTLVEQNTITNNNKNNAPNKIEPEPEPELKTAIVNNYIKGCDDDDENNWLNDWFVWIKQQYYVYVYYK